MVAPMSGHSIDEEASLLRSGHYVASNGTIEGNGDIDLLTGPRHVDGLPIEARVGVGTRTSSTCSRISRGSERYPSLIIRQESMLSYADDSFMRDTFRNMLILVIIGFVARMRNWSPLLVFSFNALGILPLEVLLSRFTTVLENTNTAAGFLFHAVMRNWVELMVAVAALFESEFSVLKAFLLGSIICNQLVVSGVHIVALHFRGDCVEDDPDHPRRESNFALIWLIIATFLVPSAVMYTTFNATKVLSMSRATSVLLLAFYVCILVAEWPYVSGGTSEDFQDDPERDTLFDDDDEGVLFGSVESAERRSDLTPALASVLLVVTLIATCLCSLSVMHSIKDASTTIGLPPELLAFALLPFVGNMSELLNSGANAVEACGSIGNAIGSSILIGLFIFPLVVVMAWILNHPLSLALSVPQCTMLIISSCITSFGLRSNSSTWIKGAGLLFVFTICSLGILYEYW